MKKLSIVIVTFLGTLCSLNAQVVDTARFSFSYNPKLSGFSKINQQAIIVDTVSSEVHFDYYITPQQPDLTFAPSPLEPAKLANDPMKRLYRDYLKVGFGYPITPLIELSIHNPDNRKYSYGLNVHHFSSWANQIGEKMKKYAYGPTSNTKAHLFFNTFFKNQTLYSSLSYNHKLAMLYGFNRDSLAYIPDLDHYYRKEFRDTLNNSYHHLRAEIGLRSNYTLEDRKFKQDVRLNYDLVSTFQKDMENHVGVRSYFAYDARFLKISGTQNYRLDFNFDFFNDQFNDLDSLAQKRKDYSVLIEFKPTINFSIKEYHLLLGAGVPIAYSLDLGKTKVPIYPVVELQLGVIKGILSIYAGLDGQTRFNSLQNLLAENPFVKPQIDSLRFTHSQINVYGGIKGNLVKKLNYHISARYAYEKDHHFFILDTASLLKNQFAVIYQNVNTLNVSFNMNWQVLSQLSLNLDANYWGYFFDRTDQVAWYSPTWSVAFSGNYVVNGKMIFDLNCDLQFGRKALVPHGTEGVYTIETMKPILNFGVGFEYIISKRFSAFATISNIAFQNYSQYYDFRAYGMNALIGITYSFGDESLINRK